MTDIDKDDKGDGVEEEESEVLYGGRDYHAYHAGVRQYVARLIQQTFLTSDADTKPKKTLVCELVELSKSITPAHIFEEFVHQMTNEDANHAFEVNEYRWGKNRPKAKRHEREKEAKPATKRTKKPSGTVP